MAGELQGRRNETIISQINVTPFVDVMLVLLVIFMVTAPIIQQGVKLDLPEAQMESISGKEEPLIVSIRKNGRIYLNDNRIKLGELKKKLKAISRIQKDKEVYLRADKNLRYGVIMNTVSAIKESGIVKLGMITRPPAGRG